MCGRNVYITHPFSGSPWWGEKNLGRSGENELKNMCKRVETGEIWVKIQKCDIPNVEEA